MYRRENGFALRLGSRQKPVQGAVPGHRGYFIVYPSDRSPSPPLLPLSKWLEEALKADEPALGGRYSG